MSLFVLNYRKRRKALCFPPCFLSLRCCLGSEGTAHFYVLHPATAPKKGQHTCCCYLLLSAPVTPAVPLENINKLLCCWPELFRTLAILCWWPEYLFLHIVSPPYSVLLLSMCCPSSSPPLMVRSYCTSLKFCLPSLQNVRVTQSLCLLRLHHKVFFFSPVCHYLLCLKHFVNEGHSSKTLFLLEAPRNRTLNNFFNQILLWLFVKCLGHH